jgi:hypothetical protein
VACGRAPSPDPGTEAPPPVNSAEDDPSAPTLDPFSLGSDDPVPGVQLSQMAGLPNPCSILYDFRIAAGLEVFWNRPMAKETFPRPDFVLKSVQCRYKDHTNPEARIVVTTVNHSSQEIIDLAGSRGFEPTTINGRNGFVRFLPVKDPPCGILLDYEFGLLLILIVLDKEDPCARANEVAVALEPAFAPLPPK